jgi:methionyl-tRNA synthetase
VVVLIQKNFDSMVPALSMPWSAKDAEVALAAEELGQKIAASIEQFRFREALAHLIELARTGNKYLAEEEPWKFLKTDRVRAGEVLALGAVVSAALAQWSEPFMPFAAKRLRTAFSIEPWAWGEVFVMAINQIPHGRLNDPGLLFEKIEDSAIDAQLEKLESRKREMAQSKVEQPVKSAEHPPLKAPISFDDFSKLDLRVGRILSAERVPKTDKLLRIEVDLGFETRTVVSGIATHFEPEDLIGKAVTVLANLEARKIKGIESQGMLLFAEDRSGKLGLLGEPEGLEAGSAIG